MKELLCNYAIVRFLPYSEIGEFVNVGVVVHCPEIDYFDFRLAKKRSRRVRQFFPELDRDVYKAAMEAIGRELKQHRNTAELFTEQRPTTEKQIAEGLGRFRGLLRRREALLHFAEPGTLLADPTDAIKDLYGRYVEREFARRDEYQETVMGNRLARWLREWGLRGRYRRNVSVGDEMFHLMLPFVHVSGEADHKPLRAIKPLDLNRTEPTLVYEHGGQWLERMRRLRGRGCMPQAMVFAMRFPESAAQRCAADDIAADLNKLDIQIVDFDQQQKVHELAQI